MKQNSRLAAPETIGFCVLGAAFGAAVSGGDAASNLTMVLACISGAVLVPVAMLMPWHRLRNLGAGRLQQADLS